MNWQQLASTSHYQTAVAVQEQLRAGSASEAAAGLAELVDALARSERRALKSHLIRLMLHLLKWKSQPDKRSRSWSASIHNARAEVADIQQETPSLTDDVIRGLWTKCFDAAKRDAEADMDQTVTINELTWGEVFEEEYRV